MREFILRARRARTDHQFDLANLPAAGRLEVVCACITNAIWVSNKIRHDVKIHIIMEGPPRPPLMMTFDASSLAGMDYHEAAIAATIQRVLKATKNLLPEEIANPQPGIFVQKKSFEALVRESCEAGKQVFYLDPEGVDARDVKYKDDVVVIFGDYIGMPSKSEKLLARLGAKEMTLGPVTLFASQCVTIVNNEMDRFFFGKK